MLRRLTLLSLLLLATLTGALAADAEKGWFGMSLAVETEGFFLNPTLQSVTIDKVAAASPAAGQGLQAGDRIIAVQGKPVKGSKALEMRDIMQKTMVGESLALTVQRGNAAQKDIKLTAVAKPAT